MSDTDGSLLVGSQTFKASKQTNLPREMALARPQSGNSFDPSDAQLLESILLQPIENFGGNLSSASSTADDDAGEDTESCSINNANIIKGEQYCWKWDALSMSSSITLDHDNKEVLFHPDYSCGTAAIRGTESLEFGWQHYWEIKMTSAIYGTDMMIGLGSSTVDLNGSRTVFASLLGKDSESWGLSYLGMIQHKGEMKQFTSKLERDAVVGMHLDMWRGVLTIYNNGKSCGVAFSGLQNKELYPMLSSTAARTRMRLEKSCCLPTNLQFLCCETIGRHVKGLESIDKLPLPPGMKKYMKNHMGWVVETCSSQNAKIIPTNERVTISNPNSITDF